MSDSAPFFRPKLLECLRGYSTRQFFADLTAGLTVGIVALPLAMAFAIASGVKPEAGIFTAVIGGFIVSALGGSRVQIGGPTGAFVVIVYGILAKYVASNLAICTIMAGFMLLVMGAAKMGTMIKFIPYPVTMGFTSGIAVLIFCTQIKDFLGLQVDKVPAEFVEKMRVLGEHVPTLQWPTAALALASLLIVVLWPNAWARRVPSSIVALVLGTGAVILFRIPVETIGTRFGGIPQGLPHMRLPEFWWPNIQNLFQPALTIALLGAIESLLSAVVADGMIDDKHDSNQELMAQGIANIKNGGHSPVAGIVHSLTLLIILLVAAPLAKFIPLATLSAVLVVVA
jgi:sulfate permease, SulP family